MVFERFVQHLNSNFAHLKQKSAHWLLAVSGGVDSIVLCDLVHRLGVSFTIAHCNFQLRGEESDRDETFVVELDKRYQATVLTRRFETAQFAEQNKLSIQVAARQLRYNWFNEILNGASNNNALLVSAGSPSSIHDNAAPQLIVTAHHANDQVETLLMNFFKGTGISGLHGILPLQQQVFRPLLIFKKEELLSYATSHQLPFVEDSSNQSDKYTRNYFRQQLIPVLQKIYPAVEDNLLNNIERFKEVETLYQQAIEVHKRKLLEPKGTEIHIPVLKLQKTIPLRTVVYEIIKDFGFATGQLEEVIALFTAETGKYVASPSHRIIRNRKWLIIAPNNTKETSAIVIEKDDQSVVFATGKLELEVKSISPAFNIPSTPLTACLNAKAISFPLLLRRWKQGDYFYPLGMKKKKKISRFLSDKKLSKTDKEKIWVLETNKKIVWVVGIRIDERFKVEPNTERILKLVMEQF